MAILDSIASPADIKALPQDALPELADAVRQRLIEVTARNGGHIGPNLGVVELTIALHRVFATPSDKFVFDVSHQGYVHKLFTGRNDPMFDAIRQSGGYSGFLNRAESPHDAFGAGHAGTALSAALGMAIARDRLQSNNHVVAILGDAAFTCGITMEALNNVADSTKRLIIILNDNEWSIAKNVGALSHYFNQIITNPVYNRVDRKFQGLLRRIPGGQSVIDFGSKWKRETKDFFVDSNLFEAYGLRYIGPIDGHDLDALVRFLEFAKDQHQPIILHLLTKKGKGFKPAIDSPEKFHGLGPFDPVTGKGPPPKDNTPPSYQNVFGLNLLKFARNDPSLIGITAAMPPGTGLSFLRENLPDQFLDVGIAEEHAVIAAAGMACEGLKPVVAIYSTFLQRAYDPIVHDVCLQNLPVTFCMDRAGLSANDGPTHHGLFDIAFLRCIPNTIIMQPKDEDELADMLWTAIQTPQPTFIRYPRGNATGSPIKPDPALIPIGSAEPICEGNDLQFWALGPWVAECQPIAQSIAQSHNLAVGVTNARFAKPIDSQRLQAQLDVGCRHFVSFEDHTTTGGFGSALLEALHALAPDAKLLRIGFPDAFVDHASSVDDLRKLNQLDPPAILKAIHNFLQKS